MPGARWPDTKTGEFQAYTGDREEGVQRMPAVDKQHAEGQTRALVAL